jgi:hypothetical protein
MKALRPLACLFILIYCLGCSSMKIEEFNGTTPELKLEEYFLGKTKGYGVVHDRFNKLQKQFVVEMDGKLEGKILTLNEDFIYNDGTKQHRTWVVNIIDEHTYEGTAGDVIGKAHGKHAGQALNWSYTLRLPIYGKEYNVDFDDWMYLQKDNILINRALMSKFGINLGEIAIFFQKE